MRYLLLIFFCHFIYSAIAQDPFKRPTEAVAMRYESSQPIVYYILNVDTTTRTVKVEMHIRNIKDTFRVAMFTHPEYDDRYWRFIKDLRVENGSATREDSAVWKIRKSGSETVITYSIQTPPAERQRAAWRPFLSSTGGLIGGPHFYIYIIGAELAPAHVQVKLPKGWQAATGLELTSDPTTFFAPTIGLLVDGPILLGNLEKWTFHIDGVPHHVIYWSSMHATNFNKPAFVDGIKKIVEQAKNLFGRLPYREYNFLIQDDSYGALEHANSVTLGAPSDGLAKNVDGYFEEIAHEYVHAWNLVRIHPVVYDGKVSFKKPALSKELWWSEGLTMYYADVFLRRAGLIDPGETRIDHLKNLLRRYYNQAGNHKVSPEKVSLAAYAPNGMLGDYMASTHLQGELIGILLDIMIRDVTGNKRSMDDVMRKMNERFSGEKGFTTKDVEQAVSEVCGCNVHSFFEDHVRGNKPLPFNKYLSAIGLQTTVGWKEAVSDDGKPLMDLKVYAWQDHASGDVLLGVSDPASPWAKAGLHTLDKLVSVNGSAVNDPSDFYSRVRPAKIGDVITIETKKGNSIIRTNVTMRGYQQSIVTIDEIKPTEKQKRLKEKWMSAEE